MVGRLDEVAQEIVDEFLGEGAGLHIGFHIDVFHLEACVFEHRADGDYIGMDLTPGQRLDGNVKHVAASLGNFEHRCY